MDSVDFDGILGSFEADCQIDGSSQTVDDKRSPEVVNQPSQTESETESCSNQKEAHRSEPQAEEIKSQLQKGICKIQEAHSLEEEGKLEDAFKSYKCGLDCLMFCSKYTLRLELFQRNLREKIKIILARAEILQKKMSQNKEGFPNDGMAKVIEKDSLLKEILSTVRPNLMFDDVTGLESIKNQLMECVILPVKFPALFKGSRHPHKGILLYGPPGTGKTMLVRAIAGEVHDLTYIRASSYDFLSRYHVDSERTMKAMFQYANEHPPALIVLDDLEGIFSENERNPQQRRLLTEFMVQFAAMVPQTFLIAITLSPWTIDAAIRRRFSKRIYFPLPDFEERKALFEKLLAGDPNILPKPDVTDTDMTEFAQKTEGFTGSDITVIVRDSIMYPVREIQMATHFKQKLPEDPLGKVKFIPCDPEDHEAIEKKFTDFKADEIYPRPVTKVDVITALEQSKPSVTQDDLEKFDKWNQDFGQF